VNRHKDRAPGSNRTPNLDHRRTDFEMVAAIKINIEAIFLLLVALVGFLRTANDGTRRRALAALPPVTTPTAAPFAAPLAALGSSDLVPPRTAPAAAPLPAPTPVTAPTAAPFAAPSAALPSSSALAADAANATIVLSVKTRAMSIIRIVTTPMICSQRSHPGRPPQHPPLRGSRPQFLPV
jgi:hypothetical protein